MEGIDRRFVTVLLRRDGSAPEPTQDNTARALIDELGNVPGIPGLTPDAVLPGWQVVGFAWGNEFDDHDGEDE